MNRMKHAPALVLAAGLALALAAPAHAVTQSWNGWKWSRTGNLQIKLGDNLGAAWKPYLAPAAAMWSAPAFLDTVVATGRSTASCGASFGTVQVCSGNYGANGWLGYANVWLSGTYIVQGAVRLNDYYFSQARYNTDAWRMATICQEIGHTIGLDHTNTVKTDANTGSCMDYTNDPSGLLGTNGPLANTGANAVDYQALNLIYATLDKTQLSATKPTMIAGAGYGINGEHLEFLTMVPEPGSWMMMLAGFGLAGAAMRRQRASAIA
jgi:hypothetical protein